MRILLSLFLVCCSLSFSSMVLASDLVLKSGEKVSGTITEKTDSYIKIDPGVGTVMTYYSDEIDTVDGQKVMPAPSAAVEIPEPTQLEAPVVNNDAPIVVDAAPQVEAAVVNDVPAEPATVPQETEPKAEIIQNQVAPEQVTDPSARPSEVLNNDTIKNLYGATSDSPSTVAATAPVAASTTAVATKTDISKTAKYTRSSQRSSKAVSDKDSMMMAGLGIGIILFIAVFFIGFYVLYCFMLYKIAIKLNTPNPWLCWVPLANIYPVIQMSGRPMWLIAFYVLSLIPFVGVIFSIICIGLSVYIWMGIAKACGKPGWLGFLILVPLVNFVVMWHLASSEA